MSLNNSVITWCSHFQRSIDRSLETKSSWACSIARRNQLTKILWLCCFIIQFMDHWSSGSCSISKFANLIKSVYKRMFLYKWPLYDLFWSFFCHMYVRLSQNWGSDNHFEVINRSYLWLVEKLWHKMQIFLHLFCFLCFCVGISVL